MGSILGIDNVFKIQFYDVDVWDSAEKYLVTYRTTGHGWWERRCGESWESESSEHIIKELDKLLSEYFEKNPDAR